MPTVGMKEGLTRDDYPNLSFTGGKNEVRKDWCSVLNRVLFDQLSLGSIAASITYYLVSDLSLGSLL